MDYFGQFQIESVRLKQHCNIRRREFGLEIIPGNPVCVPIRGESECQRCSERDEILKSLPKGVDC